MSRAAVRTVYVVEDDDNIRRFVLYALESAGFKTKGFSDGEAFFDALGRGAPDFVLLDVMLPGEDGFSILKRLKSARDFERVPVIILTAKGDERDRVRGLDSGADDYMVKPFSVRELLARVKAVLRRAPRAVPAGEPRTDGLCLNAERREATVNGEKIELTYKEFELLHYMFRNADTVLRRDRILADVWGYNYAGVSRTVDMHVLSLRNKLGAGARLIKTVRGAGYKFER